MAHMHLLYTLVGIGFGLAIASMTVLVYRYFNPPVVPDVMDLIRLKEQDESAIEDWPAVKNFRDLVEVVEAIVLHQVNRVVVVKGKSIFFHTELSNFFTKERRGETYRAAREEKINFIGYYYDGEVFDYLPLTGLTVADIGPPDQKQIEWFSVIHPAIKELENTLRTVSKAYLTYPHILQTGDVSLCIVGNPMPCLQIDRTLKWIDEGHDGPYQVINSSGEIVWTRPRHADLVSLIDYINNTLDKFEKYLVGIETERPEYELLVKFLDRERFFVDGKIKKDLLTRFAK